MASISKLIYIYRSNPISAHHILFLLLSQPSPDFCTFINHFFFLSLPPLLSFYFALLCFLCCRFVFVIFILNSSELVEAHITDIQRTYKCVRRVCLRGHTCMMCEDVLAHTVYMDVSWIPLLAPMCTRQRWKKTIGALKTYFNTENDLKEMLKWRNGNHSTFSGCFSTGKD